MAASIFILLLPQTEQKLPQTDPEPVCGVWVLWFVPRLRGSSILAASLRARVQFDNGDLWDVECLLRRTQAGFRLVVPKPLPHDVHQAVYHAACASACKGGGGATL